MMWCFHRRPMSPVVLVGSLIATMAVAQNDKVTTGRALYDGSEGRVRCVQCHGPGAVGKTGPDIRGASGHEIAFALEQVAVMMHLNKRLTKADIGAISAYLVTLD